jgi:hypothetical protein
MRRRAPLAIALLVATAAGCARSGLDAPPGTSEGTTAPARLRCELDGLVTPPVRKDSPRLFGVPSPSTHLVELDRRTLRPRPGGRVPLEAHAGAAALAPNTSRPALASALTTELQIVDLERMRVRSLMPLRVPRPLQWLAWVGPTRLLAVGPDHDERRSRIVVIDLAKRHVVRARTLPGRVELAEPTGGGLALLLSPPGRIGPATVVVADRRGHLCSVRIPSILSGYEIGSRASGAEAPVRQQIPGFTLDREDSRAFVVGGDLTVAVVDLATLGVRTGRPTEHVSLWRRVWSWLEPEARAKLLEGPQREAVSLGGGGIAVTGADYTSGRTETTAGPLGLKVIDTESWRVETLDDETSHVFRYGDTLLATADVTESRPARLRAFDLAGSLRFTVTSRFGLWVAETAAGHVYVYEDGGRLYRRVDPATGQAMRIRSSLGAWLVGGMALG